MGRRRSVHRLQRVATALATALATATVTLAATLAAARSLAAASRAVVATTRSACYLGRLRGRVQPDSRWRRLRL